MVEIGPSDSVEVRQHCCTVVPILFSYWVFKLSSDVGLTWEHLVAFSILPV